ncbi:hypothetical protein PCL1606_21790 [Pseudomonas chlororaphis]|uniref:Uncharacterized protein n=1 Tax=Pseudomonas chlororaphis TaxID=587753 RepID=A0A0D5XY36_9PSED|nr:hypothetical protein PCL1606_21790 [Pseudomonas chlororaphis]
MNAQGQRREARPRQGRTNGPAGQAADDARAPAVEARCLNLPGG